MSNLSVIKGYEKDYLITQNGEIWSTEKRVSMPKGGVRVIKAHAMKPFLTGKKGKQYLYVQLKNKTFAVHRLVALTFIPNPSNYPHVNHKDGNRLNNSARNLEWCTQKMNAVHAQRAGLNRSHFGENHGGHKLSSLDVKKIRGLRERGYTLKKLSELFDSSISNISYICRLETRIYG